MPTTERLALYGPGALKVCGIAANLCAKGTVRLHMPGAPKEGCRVDDRCDKGIVVALTLETSTLTLQVVHLKGVTCRYPLR